MPLSTLNWHVQKLRFCTLRALEALKCAKIIFFDQIKAQEIPQVWYRNLHRVSSQVVGEIFAVKCKKLQGGVQCAPPPGKRRVNYRCVFLSYYIGRKSVNLKFRSNNIHFTHIGWTIRYLAHQKDLQHFSKAKVNFLGQPQPSFSPRNYSPNTLFAQNIVGPIVWIGYFRLGQVAGEPAAGVRSLNCCDLRPAACRVDLDEKFFG